LFFFHGLLQLLLVSSLLALRDETRGRLSSRLHSLCLVWMRLISFNSSSGRAEISKLSRARAAVLGVVSTAVPRCTAHASRTCAGIFPTRAAIAEMTGSSSNPGLIP
jgi:hypothetical protein